MRNLILLCFSLCITNMDAQKFQKLNGPFGGGSKVWESKGGTLYQFPEATGYLYRSIDLGQSWRSFPLPTRAEYYKMSIGKNGTLYYLNYAQVFQSVNQGLSWTEIPLPSGTTPNAVTATMDGVLILNADGANYFSNNQGVNWSLTTFNGHVHSFHASNLPQRVYAISDEQLFVSTDNGNQWSSFYTDDYYPVDADFSETNDGQLLVAARNFIWRLDSTGNLKLKTTVFHNTSEDVSMALSSSDRLFAHENGKTYWSDDLGVHWNEMSLWSTSLFAPSLSALSATTQGSIFGVGISGKGSLYRSTDHGKNWNFSATGIPEAHITQVIFKNNLQLAALTIDGLFFSDNGGKNWTMIGNRLESASKQNEKKCAFFGNKLYSVDIGILDVFENPLAAPVRKKPSFMKNTGGWSLFIDPSSGNIFVYNNVSLYRSQDGGNQWTSAAFAKLNQLFGFENGNMLAILDQTVLLSEDQGQSWNPVLQWASPGISEASIAGDGNHAALMLVKQGKDMVIYKSEDDGKSWNPQSIDNPRGNVLDAEYQIGVNNVGNLFTVDILHDYVLKSSPDLKSLQAFGDHSSYFGNLYASPDQYLYIAGVGLYKTILPISSEITLQGVCFEDRNQNCVQDLGEPAIPSAKILWKSGALEFVAYADRFGRFRVPVDPAKQYTMEMVFSNHYWQPCILTINPKTVDLTKPIYVGAQKRLSCPYLEIDIQTNRLRPCLESTLQIHYQNDGTSDAHPVIVELTLDDSLDYQGSSIPLVGRQGNLLRFQIDTVKQFESGNFQVQVITRCAAQLGQLVCAEAHIYPDSLCVDSTFAQVVTDAICLGDSVQLIIRNIGNAPMQNARHWTALDVGNQFSKPVAIASGQFILNAGQEFRTNIASTQRILFKAEQDPTYPLGLYSQTEIISCRNIPDPAWPPLKITRYDEAEPFVAKFCMQVRNSFDPNDLTGFPIGLTDRKYIDEEQEMEYLIRFQNTGNDTAFTVRIENPLAADLLDLKTFIPGASSHPYSVVVTPDHRLIFTFSNIYLPDSVTNESGSHGFVQYKIQPKQGIQRGQKILNQAEIFFDLNIGVSTNEEFHTVGIPYVVSNQNEDNKPSTGLFIFPNPAREHFEWIASDHLMAAAQKLYIENAWGQVMKVQNIHQGFQKTVSISGLSAGCYIVRIVNGQGQTIAANLLEVMH